jgi:hypothetical protein
MALGEIYIKLVVGFPRDQKVRALVRYGADAGLARDLYVQMLLYCKENLTDGFVPAEEVGVLAYPLPLDHCEQLAKQLASVGLTKEVSKNDAQGWDVLAYLRRNGTRKDVERLSEIRAEAGRAGGSKGSKTTKPAGQKPAQANVKQLANQNGKQNASKLNPETETESSLSVVAPSGPRTDLLAAVPDATERETNLVLALIASRPGVRSAPAVLRREIADGNGPSLVAEVRDDTRPAPAHGRPQHCGDPECSPATRRRENAVTGADEGLCHKCSGFDNRRFA